MKPDTIGILEKEKGTRNWTSCRNICLEIINEQRCAASTLAKCEKL